MLKAITASLLMEQVLAPHINFKSTKHDGNDPGTIKVNGFKEPSKRVKDIIDTDMNDLKAEIFQNNQMLKAMPGSMHAEVISKHLIPKIIQSKYPTLSDNEIEELRDYFILDWTVKASQIKQVGDKRFWRMADKFINIDDLHIDLIYKVNPFQQAYEVLSKSVSSKLLKTISDTIESQKIDITNEEAVILFKKIPDFLEKNKRLPNINSTNPLERRIAEAIIFLKNLKRKKKNN